MPGMLISACNDAAGVVAGRAINIAVLANDFCPSTSTLAVAAVGQPANGVTAVAADGQGVSYTPAPGFTGVDAFSYLAISSDGQSAQAQVTVLVTAGEQGDAAPQVAPVSPALDSNAAFTATAASLEVQLPAGFYPDILDDDDLLLLSFTPVLTPTAVTAPPANLSFANVQFDLSAFVNGGKLPFLIFTRPLTLTVRYNPALLGPLNPDTLELRYWNGSEWSSDGVAVLSRDPAVHAFTAAISHLSEFACFAASTQPGEPVMTSQLFLPVVNRDAN